MPIGGGFQEQRVRTFVTYLFRGWTIKGWVSSYTIDSLGVNPNRNNSFRQEFGTPPPPYPHDEANGEENSETGNFGAASNTSSISTPTFPDFHDLVPTNTPNLS